MKEKILLKLKSQRGTTSNISDRSLEDLAETLALSIATDEQLAAMNFAPLIASLDGNLNHYTAEQVKKAREADEAKKAEELKKAEEAKKASDAKNKNNNSDDTPEWAKVLIDSNKALTEKITVLEQEKARQEKIQKAQSVIKASKLLPDNFKEKWSGRINVESETPIEDQVKALENEYTELHSTIVGQSSGKGLPSGSNAPTGQPTKDAINEVISKI